MFGGWVAPLAELRRPAAADRLVCKLDRFAFLLGGKSMAENCVLIFAKGADTHCYAVEAAINMLGGTAFAINTDRLGSGSPVSVDYSSCATTLKVGGFEGPPGNVCSSWNRRLSQMFMLPPNLHPADVSFVRADLRSTLMGILGLLDERFPVNPIAAARIQSNKLKQLEVARRAGFRIPKTLISNDFEDIRSFMGVVGHVCMKPYDTHGWKTDKGPVQALTVRLDENDVFDREAFEVSPHIFQEYIDKVAEYRVVLFGGFSSCVRIDSTTLADQAKIDWRSSPAYLSTVRPSYLPESVLGALRQILAKLGLRFGVFDLAETADGKFVFFEVNQQGQWLWQEWQCPDQPILQPFGEYLLQARDDYRWDPAHRSDEFAAADVCRALDSDPRFREQDVGGIPDEVVHVSDERQSTIPT